MLKTRGGVFGRNPTFNDVTARTLSLTDGLIINGQTITGLDYNGAWNASTNTPALTSSVGQTGSFYIVSVAGSTTLDGISNWAVGDWALFNGTAWQRIEGGADGNFVNLSSTGLATLADVIANDYRLGASGIVTESGTSKTLSSSDNGKVIYCTSNSATTINTASGLGAGFSCTVIQGGAGQISIAQGANTTLVGYASMYKSAGQYAAITIVCPVANTFVVAGNTAA